MVEVTKRMEAGSELKGRTDCHCMKGRPGQFDSDCHYQTNRGSALE